MPKEHPLEALSMDAVVNVGAVFSGHDSRTALPLLATLLCRSQSARPKLERTGARDSIINIFTKKQSSNSQIS